jgi:hypothetical protein
MVTRCPAYPTIPTQRQMDWTKVCVLVDVISSASDVFCATVIIAADDPGDHSVFVRDIVSRVRRNFVLILNLPQEIKAYLVDSLPSGATLVVRARASAPLTVSHPHRLMFLSHHRLSQTAA